MDFKKFQQWCQDRGFITTLPSGCIRVNNLDVKDFGSFKGLFSLCWMFFEDESVSSPDGDAESSKAFEKELSKEKKINEKVPVYKDGNTSPSGYFSSDDEGINTLERIYENDKVNKNRQHSAGAENGRFYETYNPKFVGEGTYQNSELKSLVDKVADKYDSKYSDEDFKKVFNYLLTPDVSGIVPMDEFISNFADAELLDSLEN